MVKKNKDKGSPLEMGSIWGTDREKANPVYYSEDTKGGKKR